MAAQHPLHYLAQVGGTEIRAYKANRVVLLKMADEQSTTVCCRPAESQDLIIRDFQTGEIKFCISGAEIIDHLITVYYTPNQPIGTIKNDGIIESLSGSTISITCQQGVFKIENASINFRNDSFLISFDVNSSVEKKALTIAFAIHLAVTNKAGKLKKTLDVDIANVDVVDFASLSYRCLPERNKTDVDKVFSKSAADQRYHLIEMAQMRGHDYVLALLDDSPRHNVVLLVCHRLDDRMFYVMDVDGRLIYSASNKKNGELDITEDTLFIGKITNFKSGCVTTLITIEQPTPAYFTAQPQQDRGLNRQILNSNGNLLVQFNNDYPPVLSGTMAAQLSESQKKVIFGYWFLLYAIVSPFSHRTTTSQLSVLKCSCLSCTPPLDHRQQSDTKTQQLFNVMNRYPAVYTMPVGHNSQQNIVYFNVSARSNVPMLTLECTPFQNMFGFVKLVAKDRYGLPGFHAICLPPANNVAVYDRTEALIAYEENDKIYDANHQVIMEISKTTLTAGNLSFFLGYELIDPASKQKILYAKVNLQTSIVSVKREEQGSGNTNHTLLQSAVIMSLAVKLFWIVHQSGGVITPEISYRYSSWTKDAKIPQLLKPKS